MTPLILSVFGDEGQYLVGLFDATDPHGGSKVDGVHCNDGLGSLGPLFGGGGSPMSHSRISSFW